MLKRCIMIFPEFQSGAVIKEIREKYDPLAIHVKPHITLVFPFESEIEAASLRKHIAEILSEVKPFKLELSGFTESKTFGKYLFLNVTKGREEIIKLHKALYTALLENYYPGWLKNTEFMPHMTVGSFKTDSELNEVLKYTQGITESFKTIVDRIGVEVIDENEDSIIESEIMF